MAVQDVGADLYARRPWTKHYEPGVPTTIDYPDVTLQDLLLAHAARYPDRPAIVFYDRALSYRQLEQLSARFAAALARLGLRPGDRLALLLPSCPQFVIGYYGGLRAGAVVVPCNPLYVEPELQYQLDDSGAKVVLTLSKVFPTVQAVRSRTRVEQVIVTSIKEYFPAVLRLLFTLTRERREGHRVALPVHGRTHWLQHLLRGAPARPPAVAVSPDDVALLQYTGGTTGLPKGAMLTQRNLVTNALVTRAWLAGSPRPARGYDLIVGVLPLFHCYGLTTVMNCAIAGAGAMLLLPRFEPRAVLEAIERHRPNLFPGVPALYRALNNVPDVQRYDLSSVTACVSGADALPADVQRRFEQLTGAHLVEGYGLTEASPITHCNPLHGLSKPGSIGIPVPDTEARIVDVETGTKTLPVGEAGELVVRGPQVMQGYWNRPDETAQALRDGWLYTGDIARMDEDGYFFIVDRKKDLIKVGGLNVYPREVEEALYEHPKVKEAAAVGVPDPRWGEVVKVFVVLKEGETATPREIIRFCRERMAGYKVPRYVEFRQELPRTMIGKVLRRALRPPSPRL